METALVISIATCICLILTVLIKPSIEIHKHTISIYWIIALTGAILLICTGRISMQAVMKGLSAKSAVNPIKILVLFLSMSTLSIFLDEIGFFRYLASYTLLHAKASQKSLFISLYLMVSVLTVFTSNDIIILTFTPFICYFSKNAKIDPTPYLFTEFVAANTWSMMFIIGNPTNIYLATANGIDFAHYFVVMAFPTILAGVTAFIILYLIFRKSLEKPIKPDFVQEAIKDRGLLVIGLIHLGICTVLLVISSYIGIEMWLITLCFAISLFVSVTIYKKLKGKKGNEQINCLKRVPWELVPFVLSMFVLVLTMDSYNVTGLIAHYLESNVSEFTYGPASFLTANLINNIPMSVLFCPVLNSASDGARMAATYASVIGSNLGALLTPIGALAAIMWSSILKENGVKFSFVKYVKYGAAVSVPTLFAALAALYVILL